MGDYRITIEAVGGHGCDRESKQDGQLVPCNRIGCPDCEVRHFVDKLHRIHGQHVKKAELVHWPADLPGYTDAGEVRDDLLAGKRTKGSFRK